MDLYDENLTCSFCGKHRTTVKAIIAGPAVYICSECVQLCSEILEEKFREQYSDGAGI